MAVASYLNAIETALPPHDVHRAFIDWATAQLTNERERAIFARMADRAGIAHRMSILPPPKCGGTQTDPGGFYGDAWPGTAERMRLYAEHAPRLAAEAAGKLGPLDRVTHLVLASCTGFVAPGIDQILARQLGLSDTVERTLIGFMGCYAAVTALKTAHHIVRSEPDARVLVVTVELSTLHLQQSSDLESLLAMLLFADGAAAALVTSDAAGLEIEAPFALALPDSDALITWNVGDTGFAMGLSGEVPGRISSALATDAFLARIGDPQAIDSWAVHAGGRSVLDAVENGLSLPAHALEESRSVLRDHGNMSSSTLMFALERILAGKPVGSGVALAFGPGLAVEGFRYCSP
ncbi:type III polyketide synthase [Sphingomonas sp. AX6]|uniref:type III polyketide synthase n=1 Tax=Sphingomonas sp. AX6 TaxID=2653171 RepID=UPI0012F21D8A|nr:type III polyketide synthase [Sphingomonas sp. AX6]VXC99202.1 Type III polyketide synthase [Sphingomonas sp. AX6]